ncbi:hypothetical protein CB0940_01641 [Cercospora beticola]|uniref:Uncharacterized protein n=1 Tax=Cercospora beticola TaxID=122368 RepID=A0A2G5IBT6_CERBT|nr:hypothetical protein CB0940_01641 [Cercospora beticola]PIB02278.1 hypothetical protein CB0940_01641 [Cercospora beticola]WPA97083.1 hypothetical protein RHO25_001691 [Cercospora beticola]
MARDNHDSFLSVDFRVSLRFTAVSSTQTGTTRKKKQLSSPASAPPPPIPATAPAALNDVPCPDTREASLSPTTRQMQRRIRTFYHQHLEELRRLEGTSENPRSTTQAPLSRAAEMDRRSLQTLEAASTQVAKLPSRPLLKAASRPKQQARSMLPTRHLRSYQGTPPYETPSSATGTNFDIHSIPTNLPTTPTYSDLFRSDIEEKFNSPHRSAGSPSHQLPPSPTFQQALDAQNVQRSPHANVEGWLRDGTAGTSQASSVQAEDEDALFGHGFEGCRTEPAGEDVSNDALKHAEQVANDQLEEAPVIIDRTDLPEEQAYGAGNSSDSWSDYEPEQNDDHADGSALAQDAAKEKSSGSSEDAQDWELIGSDSSSRSDPD